MVHICPICQKSFTQLGNMKRHMNNLHSTDHIHIVKKNFVCPNCQTSFTRKDNMKQHIEKFHKNANEKLSSDPTYQTLVSKINKLTENNETLKSELKQRDEILKSELKEQIRQELQNIPTNNITNNQILNIVCVTNHDNYLDIVKYVMECHICRKLFKSARGYAHHNDFKIFQTI